MIFSMLLLKTLDVYSTDDDVVFIRRCMYSLAEEKLKVHLATGTFCFWQGNKAENVYFYF